MDFLSYSSQLQRLLEALGLTLLHSFWQGLIVMILLWALLRLIRQEKANLRFGLAMAALFLLMTAFAGTFYYEWESLKPVVVVAQEAVSVDIPLTELSVKPVEPTFWEQIQREANAVFFQLSENAVWMAGLWLLGSLFFSARLGLGLWQVRQLRQQRDPFPEHWQQIATGLQQKLGIRRKVSFSCSEQVESPLTLGWLKPVILLPSAMLMAMPADQLESILVHELAHIRRHDYLWNLLQSLAEVLLFYHPAYWYMASVLEQEREMACDAITLKVTGRPQVYAQALLQVAALRTTFSPVALSARGSTRSRSGFAERIKRIVMPDYQKKNVQPLPFLLSFCLIGMLLFAFTLKSPVDISGDAFIDDIQVDDSLRFDPYLHIYGGDGQMIYYDDGRGGNLANLPTTGEHDPEDIHYAPSFDEVMQQVPDMVLDTSSLTIGEIYSQYISLDQSLNSFQKSLDESEEFRTEKVMINFSAPNVLYLLDGVAVDPKKVTRYEVSNIQVFPGIAVDGVDTSRYKLVVKAESRDNGAQKLNEQSDPDKQNINKKSSPKTLDNSFNIKKASPGTIISDEGSISGDSVLYFVDGKRVGDDTAYDSLNIKTDEIVSVDVSKNEAVLSLLSKHEQEKYKGIVYVRTSRAGKAIIGTITDAETGKPLPGINIIFKGSTTGTVSNPEGKFQIKIPEGGEELRFLFIGYEDKVVSIEGKESMDVSLKPLSAEAKQKKLEELETKRAERISRQLPALSSLDSTLVVVNGQARKEVKSLSELNIPPDEILAINVMGTEADLSQYLDASDRGRYKKLVRIITKRGRATFNEETASEPNTNKLVNPAQEDSILFIVDDLPIEHSQLKNLDPNGIKNVEVKKGSTASQFMTPTQQEKYNAVVMITTKKGYTLEKPTSEKTFNVFPNPGNDEVKVRFNLQEAGPLEFQLLDKEGGFLKSFEQDFSFAGDQEISIPVDELPADTYFLRVKLNGQYETRRVIVQ